MPVTPVIHWPDLPLAVNARLVLRCPLLCLLMKRPAVIFSRQAKAAAR